MDQKEKDLRDRKSLKLFLIIALGVSFLIEIAYIIVSRFTDAYNGFFLVAIMWTPAVTALVLTLKNYKSISMLGVTIGRAKPILLGLFIPFVYLLLSYFAAWAIFGDETIGFKTFAIQLGQMPDSKDLPVFFVLSHVMVGILPSCAGAFGEELGWRGFMYPIMERVTGRKKALLLSGGIFAIWHLPLVIAGLYNIDTVLWYGVIMFMIYTVILGFILAWLRSISDSILPPLLVHASSNLFGQMVFNGLTTDKRVHYLAGETGIITIALMALTAFIGWKLWKKHDIKNSLVEK